MNESDVFYGYVGHEYDRLYGNVGYVFVDIHALLILFCISCCDQNDAH